MGEFFFNIDHGYLEALIRGFKGGLLNQADYTNLVQCETLEGKFYLSFSFPFCCEIMQNFLSDLKLHVQSTDYGNFLANEPGAITVSSQCIQMYAKFRSK